MEKEAREGARLPLTTSVPPSPSACGVDDGAWLPRTAAAALSGMVCSADRGCLPLTTTASLSDIVCSAGGDCLPLIIAPPWSEAVGRGGNGAGVPPSALLDGEGCRSEDAGLPLSAAVLLRTGVSGTDRSWAAGSAA